MDPVDDAAAPGQYLFSFQFFIFHVLLQFDIILWAKYYSDIYFVCYIFIYVSAQVLAHGGAAHVSAAISCLIRRN